MTKISRIPLDPIKMRALHDTFCAAIGSLRSRVEIEEFLFGILTPTERKMLAKRLTIAKMLLHNAKYHDYRDAVRVTNGTIAHVQSFLYMHGDGMRRIIKKLKNL